MSDHHWDVRNSRDADVFDVSRSDRLIDVGDDSAVGTDAGEGGNAESDEKAALLQRQKKMQSRPEPTGDTFADYIQPTAAEFLGAVLFIYVGVVSGLSPSAIVRGAAHGLTLGALIVCFQDIRYW